jgi:hypothetical protein
MIMGFYTLLLSDGIALCYHYRRASVFYSGMYVYDSGRRTARWP